MNKQSKETKKPDYTSAGVGVWINKTKDNKEYLSIKIIGHEVVHAFRVEKENSKPMEIKQEHVK